MSRTFPVIAGAKPRVFLVGYNTLETKARNYDSLARWSDLEPIRLTEGLVRLNMATRHQIALKLQDFQPDDYLALSGSNMLCALAVAILLETYGLPTIKVLLYQPRTMTYAPDIIDGYVDEFAWEANGGAELHDNELEASVG